MSDARQRRLSGGIIMLVGLLVAAIPGYDIYEDIVLEGDPILTTLVENLPVIALCGATVAGGIWIAQSDWKGRYAWTVARLTVLAVVGVAVLVALVVFVQFRLQAKLKPLVIAGDAIVIGAFGAMLIGIRTAQQDRSLEVAEHQRNRARALFENHTDAVAFVERADDKPVVADVNRTFEEVFGQKASEIDHLRNLDATEESPLPAGEAVFTDKPSQSPTHQEVTHETVHGEREFIRQTVPVSPTSDTSQEAYVVYTDITEQKEREHQLEFLNSLLRHDIQNGMTVIRSRAEHLAERLEGREAEFAATIKDRSDDLAGLTDQFQVMLDALTGDVEEGLGPVALGDVIEDQVEVLETSFPDVEVAVTVPNLTVQADDLLPNVIWNLLSNAVEHNDADTPRIRVSAEETEDGDAVRLEIADNGPGIPDELKQAVFRRQESAIRNEVGSGFGLFFVDRMVTRYDGSVWAEDNDPRGTVFVVRLPKTAE